MAATKTPSAPATDDYGFPATYADDAPADTDDGTFPLVSPADRDPDPITPAEEPPVATATKSPPAGKNGKAEKKAAPAPKTPKTPKPRKAGTAPAAIGVVVPEGRPVELDYAQLVFDRRVQMRAGLFDEATVETYRTLLQEGHSLGRLKVLEIPEEQAKELGFNSPYVVWDGFQRGEARKRARLTKNIPCEVSKGDWTLALRLAMLANSDHGSQRSTSDLRRLFQKLLENESLLATVLAEGKDQGGANRALSAAAGISKGLVSKILNQMGYSTRGNKVVTIEQGRKRPTKKADRVDPKTRQYQEDPETIKKKVSAVIIQEMCMAAAGLQRRYEALFEREDAVGIVKEVAAEGGYAVREDQNPTQAPGSDKTTVVTTRHWPLVDDLLNIMEEVKAQHEKLTTKPTA